MVSMSKNGSLLMLNAPASRIFKDADRVLLLFDADERRLAIRPADPDDERGFKLNHMPSGANISCRTFAEHYKIERGGQWELSEEADLYCASVN